MDSIDICKELHQNFIDFAYEANSARAFPDARDGLKPGQRACLWEMYSKGYTSNKPHVKSAKISGGTIASWWPHGSTAIYETFGRMSMNWINNIPEVNWHGNNGNIVIGQALAADRYTEARLEKAIEEGMFYGIKKNNVTMIPNFSEDAEWPEVLPAVLPRLLVNGSQGIGVTIANCWLNMNFREVGEVIIDYIRNRTLPDELFLIDFPSGGIIINKNELPIIHKTGKGKVILRGRTEIEDNTIKITELPYQVYVEPFIDEIKKLIENNELTEIKDIYNKTDKKRLLIEIECTNSPLKVLNKLYEKTSLQSNYNANQWALVGKTPKLLTLEEYIKIYIEHNISCITKEFNYDLDKAKHRIEIVNGLLKALEDIDNIIALIKKSKSSNDAIYNLIETYSFSEVQAKAIVDMKLGRLANLEQIELQKEAADLNETLKNIMKVLSNEDEKNNILIERLNKLIKAYGTPRKTELTFVSIDKNSQDKEIAGVEPEKCIVTMTESGLIKRIPLSNFKVQKRKGRGIKTTDDIIKCTIRTDTIDNLMIFTNFGKMYRILVNDIPVGTNTSKGTKVSNLIQLEPKEEPVLIYSIYRGNEKKYIVFATKKGLVKKSLIEDYVRTKKKNGIIATAIRDGDSLTDITLIDEEDFFLITKNGYIIRVSSKEFPALSRTASGLKGIVLHDDDEVVNVLPIRDVNDDLTIFYKSGFGKKVKLTEFFNQKRAGKGLICCKNEIVAGACLTNDEDNVLINGGSKSICISAKDIPILSRTATGLQMIKDNSIDSITKI